MEKVRVSVIESKAEYDPKSILSRDKIRVAAYCRVSTMSDEQETSIINQKTYYKDYIEKKPEWVLVDIYSDDGKSGTSTKGRPEFNRMIEDAMNGKIDLIITKSVSRFARNTIDSIATIKQLREKNVGIFFESDQTNTLDSKWDFTITMLSAFAEEESRAKSVGVKWGFARRFEKGESLMSNLYGYDTTAKPYAIIEQEAKVVRRIFREYLEGTSCSEIARRLNEEDIKTKFGNEWTATGIKQLIENEKYTGNSMQLKTYSPHFSVKKRVQNIGQSKKYYIENAHAPIISEEVYLITQREIKRRREISLARADFEKNYNLSNAYSHKYALSNVLVCAHCGTRYRRQIWTARGNRRVVWRCANRMDNGVESCPNSVTLHEKDIQFIVVKAINSMIEDRKVLIQNLKNKLKKADPNYVDRRKIELLKLISDYDKKYKVMIENRMAKQYHPDPTLHKGINPVQAITNELNKFKVEYETLLDQCAIEKSDLAYLALLIKELENTSNHVIEYSDNIVNKMIQKIEVISETEIRIIFINGYTYTN
ncbi:MAG: recombinase family protein [Anaerorhabdus sp.]|uniref:recombinase family protein n=1 Tax=Anaerorhabdus sp. TaxID=1872524 RepID=UPI002FCA27B3